jgi:polysaccharide pyruvyl transferase WcaK-like protein
MRSIARKARVWLLALAVHALARIRRRRAAGATGAPIAALIGAYGNGNYGDEIIGIELIRELRSAGYAVTLVARGPDTARLDADRVVVAGGGLRSVVKCAWACRNASVAVLGGGGLFEGRIDDVGVHRLVLEYAAKLLTIGVHGGTLIIHGIGVSARPFADGLVASAVAATVRAVDHVSVRDRASVASCAGMGVAAVLVRDPATTLFPEILDTQPGLDAVAVVVLDRHLWPTFSVSSAGAVAMGNRASDINLLADLAQERLAGLSEVMLLPFHFSDPPLLSAVAQELVSRGVEAERIRMIPYPLPSAVDAFRLLSSCRSVITMRFHPALVALEAGRDTKIVGSLQKLDALQTDGGGSITVQGAPRSPIVVLAEWLQSS